MLYTNYSHKYRVDHGHEDAVEITIDARDVDHVWLDKQDLENMLEELKKAKEDV